MTEFNQKNQAERTFKYGVVKEVDLNLTPLLLEIIFGEFTNMGEIKAFTSSKYTEKMRKHSYSQSNPPKRVSELERLRKNGWLGSKVYNTKKGKRRVYFLSKKSKDYLDTWGEFVNPAGPLIKEKKTSVEKVTEVIQERNHSHKESFEEVY